MVKTIVIKEKTKIACIYDENQSVTDLIFEREESQVDDIYVGIIESILPSVNAAFINLGAIEGNGFIHLKNLGYLQKKHNSKNIRDHIFTNSNAILQVLKAANNRKGPTLTGEITIKGRYMSLIPFKKKIVFSHNFDNSRSLIYLRNILFLLKPKSIGLYIHKSAKFTSLENIIQEFYTLLHKWNSTYLNSRRSVYPLLVSKRDNFIYKILKKFYNNGNYNVIVDSFQASKKVASIINNWKKNNNLSLSVKYFTKHNFLVRNYNLDLIIYNLLQSRINLNGGGYIVIEKTEALTTIDVNSGSFNYLNNPRETMLLVNKKASKQIAKHLQLRNISGVIIIDFIDMKNQEDQLNLLIYFEFLLHQDKQKTKIIQFSELGLVELTRKREYKSVKELFHPEFFYDLKKNVCISKVVANSSFGHSLFLENAVLYSN
nr:ribonuclease E [Rhodomonas sp. NIES-698]